MTTYSYGFEDYLRVIRQRWVAITLVIGAVTIAALLSGALRQDDGTVAEQPLDSDRSVIALDIQPFPLDSGTMASAERERLTILSDDVIGRAVEALPGTPTSDEIVEALEITPLAGTNTLMLRTSSVGEARPQMVGEAVAEAYLEAREEAFTERFRIAEDALQEQLRSARSQAGPPLVVALRVSALQNELARLESLRSTTEPGEILSSAAYADVVPSPAPTSSPAPVVAAPASPVRNGIAGLVLGAILGFGLALVLDLMDPRFRSAREVRETLPIPVLAELPDEVSSRARVVEEIAIQVRHLSDHGSQKDLVLLGTDEEAGWLQPVLQDQLHRIDAPVKVAVAPSLSSVRTQDALVVLDMKSDRRRDTHHTLEVLQRAGANALGIVLVS